jgi:hypothetical protein
MKLTKIGIVAAGATAGAILAVSPVFAHGTAPTPANPTTDAFLASVLSAAQTAGLTAAQTKELLAVAAELSATPEVEPAQAAETDEDADDTDEDADDQAQAPKAAPTGQTSGSGEHESEGSGQGKGDD